MGSEGQQGSPAEDGGDEFAGIKTSRRMRSPLLALAAIGLASLLLWQLRDDLRYALSPKTPQDLGAAPAAYRAGLVENQYVRISGQPDRANAVFLDTRGKDKFRQFFRLLGTSSNVLVLRTFGELNNRQTAGDIFEGRLLSASSISFMDSIRDYFAKRMTGARFIEPAALAGALDAVPSASGRTELADLAGDKVTLSDKSQVVVEVRPPDEYRFVMTAPRFASPAQAREALSDAGVLRLTNDRLPVDLPGPPAALLVSGRPHAFMRLAVRESVARLAPDLRVVENPEDPSELYVSVPATRYPDGLPQLVRALGTAGLMDARPPPIFLRGRIPPARRDGVLSSLETLEPYLVVYPRTEEVRSTVAELRQKKSTAQNDGFEWKHVSRVLLPQSLKLPESAYVLVEGETPSSYTYVPILYVILTVFLGYNLFALWTVFYRLLRAGRQANS